MTTRTARVRRRDLTQTVTAVSLGVTVAALSASLTLATLGMAAHVADTQPVAPHVLPVAVETAAPVHVEPATTLPRVQVSDGPAWAGGLPACPEEDSRGCYWDATARGNGEGRSFTVDAEGRVTYRTAGEK